METIAVFGASGFIGTTFVERVTRDGRFGVRSFVNSGRNAWRLARLGVALERVDLLDRQALTRALEGCSYVVNCVMGPRRVMFDGLTNLLEASKEAGIRRFIHISSITAYGEPPPPESVNESATPRPRRGTYGWIKATQDEIVAKAARHGLPCVTLCPPIVSGPRSTQLLWLLRSVNEGRFAQIDDGSSPCAVVDVDNLAHAMMLALNCDSRDGKRIFVLDDVVPTWAEVLSEISPLLTGRGSYPVITREEAEKLIRGKNRPPLSLKRSLRHLVSPGVRQSLLADPLFRFIASSAKQAIPSSALNAIRSRASMPSTIPRSQPKMPTLDLLQLARQTRGVRHSSERARSVLNYEPVYTFSQSMSRFRKDFLDTSGLSSEYADLIAVLNE